LLSVYRFRRQIIHLDYADRLTQGSPIGLGLLLRHLRLGDYGDYAAVVEANSSRLLGRMRYTLGRRAAHLTFLMPQDAVETTPAAVLLDSLAAIAGERGALCLVAQAADEMGAFELLRRSGFAVYAWQRFWRVMDARPPEQMNYSWRPYRPADENAVRSFHQQLTPPLVQAAEAFEPRFAAGWVFYQADLLRAYIDVQTGPRGVCLQPLIHPEVADAGALLDALLAYPDRWLGRPVYMAARSYQAWLEPLLEARGDAAGPRHSLMVRHLVVFSRVLQPAGSQAALEKGWLGPTPSVHTIKDNKRVQSDLYDTETHN
jgi:hypothetical protein